MLSAFPVSFSGMSIDWTFQLYEQLDWQWREHMRPRWDGLTDDEYFWEPVPGMWNVRPRGTSKAETSFGAGDFTCDYAWPEPDPAPVTTIALTSSRLAALNSCVCSFLR